MSNIQAAIGLGQLERIVQLTQRKREILAYYKLKLEVLSGVSMNPEPNGITNGAWMPTVVFSPTTGVTREKLLAAFAVENIDARVFFHPLSSLPMFEPRSDNVVAWDVPRRAINLPSFHDMTIAEQDCVIAVVERRSLDSPKACR
jgi:perosamine synthetase